MNLNGLNFSGKTRTGRGTITFYGVNPATGEQLTPGYLEATAVEVDDAVQKAAAAFGQYRNKTGQERAPFLETIAEEIMALGGDLIERSCIETGLPEGRITGELPIEEATQEKIMKFATQRNGKTIIAAPQQTPTQGGTAS